MYYFVSDIHLGAGVDSEQQRALERRFVEWLDMASKDAKAIFLLGDIFDFWFEYQHVVPKGFVRTLATLARITESGVRVVFMAGNHDQWLGGYLERECGLEVYTSPQRIELDGVKIHIAHGDNLNVKGDWKLQLINRLFRSQSAKVLFSWLVHPDLSMRFGHWWSNSSRGKHSTDMEYDSYESRGIKPLLEYAAMQQEQEVVEHYIFGHMHQSYHHCEAGYSVLFISNWTRERGSVTYGVMDGDGNLRGVEL